MEVIYYLGVSHALFGSAILFTKRPKHSSNFILGIWILLLAIFLVGLLLPFPVITFFKPGLFPIYLCYGPFLFLYIKSLTTESFIFSRRELLHFLPFLLVVLHRSISDPVNFGVGGGHDFRNEGQLTNFFYYSIATISIASYTIFAFFQISKHKGNLKNIYSYKSSRYTLAWLRIIVSLFFLVFTFHFVAWYFNIFFTEIRIPFRFQSVGSVFFIIAASFFGINQPVIIAQKTIPNPIDESNKSLAEDEKKYTSSSLSDADISKIKSDIINNLQSEKPFLDPEYNINNLAGQLGLPRHHITQVINTSLNKNFYTLINDFRIEEVISRMKSKEFSNYTLLAIALDSGFNSKSAFNRVFKQTTGKTPSEYKASKAPLP